MSVTQPRVLDPNTYSSGPCGGERGSRRRSVALSKRSLCVFDIVDGKERTSWDGPHAPLTLLGADGEESCDPLLHFSALTLGACELPFFILSQGHSKREGLLAFLAMKAIDWHGDTLH